MADMRHPIPGLGIVEALVLNLPPTLGHPVERQGADLTGGPIGEPVGLDNGPVRLVLAVADHPDGRPTECLPRIEVVGIPELDTILAHVQRRRGGHRTESHLDRLG